MEAWSGTATAAGAYWDRAFTDAADEGPQDWLCTPQELLVALVPRLERLAAAKRAPLRVLVAGCGTSGVSAALHDLRRGDAAGPFGTPQPNILALPRCQPPSLD